MPSFVFGSRLYGEMFSTAQMDALFSDEAIVQRYLDVEVALAHVQAKLGIIPAEAASAIGDSADINTLFTSDELSQALGRENVVHVALRQSSIAERFSKSCDRLAGIKRPQPSPASPAPVSELTDATYREEIE